MKDKPLKAGDIAEMAGISGSDMKRIAGNYDQVIPSRVLGRVKIYEQKAAGIVEKISSMEAAGKSSGDIIRELGGKVTRKSTKERAEEKIRKDRSTGGREKRNAAPAAPTAGKSPAKNDKTAFLELKLDKLTNRVEKLEKELESEKKGRKKDRDEFLKTIAAISESIGSTGRWVDYFEKTLDEFSGEQTEFNDRTREWIDYTEGEIEFLKRPFWKRRR